MARNMAKIDKKKLSLYVAWFHILVCIAVPIYIIVNICIDYQVNPEYFEKDLKAAAIVVACLIPWLTATIFLIKGINENRSKLVLPWVCLGCLLAILSFGHMIYMTYVYIMFGGITLALISIWPLIAISVVMVLCVIPVSKLYKEMSLPPPVQPTQVVLVPLEPKDEADPRYMPVFEDV